MITSVLLTTVAILGTAGWQPRVMPPEGWAAAMNKSLELTLAERHREVIALFEQWVAKHPDFPDGHAMLGGAHETYARDLRRKRTPGSGDLAVKHYEIAANHLRRAIELERSPSDFSSTYRSLIDLYGVIGLNRPAERERLIREGIKRFPSDALAHAYYVEMVAMTGQPIDAAVRSALAGIPRTAEARQTLAGALRINLDLMAAIYGDVVSAAVLRGARTVIDDALALDGRHVDSLREKANILRAQAQFTKGPERTKLLAEAERLDAEADKAESRRNALFFQKLPEAQCSLSRPKRFPESFLARTCHRIVQT